MNQPFNPYQHNVDILRGFFRKPIILITALTFCVPTICKIVTAVSSMMISFKYIIEKNENVNLSFSIDISTLAFLFAFILLFCTARSRRPIVKLKPPVTFLRVLTIIFTAFTGISLAVSLIFVILLIVFGSDVPEDIFRTSAILLGINFISTLCEFIFFLASCKLTKGIKYSLSSVFITKAGAKATAVSGFVYAVISVISSVIGYMFISGSIDALFYFATQISGTLERSGVNFSSNFVNNSELFDTVTNVANTLYPITLVCGIIELIPFIFVSIVALMYFNYIKRKQPTALCFHLSTAKQHAFTEIASLFTAMSRRCRLIRITAHRLLRLLFQTISRLIISLHSNLFMRIHMQATELIMFSRHRNPAAGFCSSTCI